MSISVKETVLEADVFLPDQLFDGGPGMLLDPVHTSEKCVPLTTDNCVSGS